MGPLQPPQKTIKILPFSTIPSESVIGLDKIGLGGCLWEAYLYTNAMSTISQAEEKLEPLKSRLREAIIEQGARVRKLEGKPEKEKEEALKRQETLRADYKAVTGKEWSDVRDEGPILLTSNAVRGNEVRLELKQRLLELRRQNIIR